MPNRDGRGPEGKGSRKGKGREERWESSENGTGLGPCGNGIPRRAGRRRRRLSEKEN